MEPAISIIEKLGGASKVASLLGVHRTRVYAWTYAKSAGGTGGLIPQAHHRALLRAAAAQGIALRAEDLLPVEPQDEV